MATYVSREERIADILKFLHSNWLVNEQRVSIGEYARFARMSKSPHLRQIFLHLLDAGMVEVIPEKYRATVVYVFKPNYEHIAKFYPEIKRILMDIGWQEALL